MLLTTLCAKSIAILSSGIFATNELLPSPSAASSLLYMSEKNNHLCESLTSKPMYYHNTKLELQRKVPFLYSKRKGRYLSSGDFRNSVICFDGTSIPGQSLGSGQKLDSDFEFRFDSVGSFYAHALAGFKLVTVDFELRQLWLQTSNLRKCWGHIEFCPTKIDISMSSYPVWPEMSISSSMTKISERP